MDPEATDEEIKKRFRQVSSFCTQSSWRGSRIAVGIVQLGVGTREMVLKLCLGRGVSIFGRNAWSSAGINNRRAAAVSLVQTCWVALPVPCVIAS